MVDNTPMDELGFTVLDAIRGDRVKANDKELEVTSSAHLIAKSDGEPDLYGFYGANEEGQEFRVTVKPDISDSDDYVDEIEIVRIKYRGGVLEGDVDSFEFIERSKGNRVPKERYVEIFTEEKEAKGN